MGILVSKILPSGQSTDHDDEEAVSLQQEEKLDMVEELKELRRLRKKVPGELSDAEHHDTFSLIMVADFFSWTSLLVLAIFIIQTVTYILSIYEDGSIFTQQRELKPNPFLGCPRGATSLVLVSQGLAILIISLVKESFWQGLISFILTVAKLISEGNIREILAKAIRIVEGCFGVAVIFIHIIRSDDVVYLMKDFTAMTFISELDNIAFIIADMKFLGHTIENDCKKLRRKQEDAPSKRSSKFYCINIRFFILSVIISTLLAVWVVTVVEPIRSNKFLCQKIYIQLKDDIIEDFSYHSGNYIIQDRPHKVSSTVTYFEDANTNTPMILRYCENVKVWAFTLPDPYEENNECKEEFFRAQSMKVLDEETFNVFEVPPNFWFYKDSDSQLIRSSIFMLCNDENNPKPPLPPDSQCNSLQTTYKKSTSSDAFLHRKFSSKYTVLTNSTNHNVTVNNRPVYFNQTKDLFDIVFFLGRRWAITSSKFLIDYIDNEGNNDMNQGHSEANSRDTLSDYLENKFHGRQSNYSIDLFSESVLANTPNDRLAPIDLKWYPVRKKESPKRVPNERLPVEIEFICSLCHYKTNPCYYDNKCNGNTGICDCKDGTSGSLCEKLPTGNGFCNMKFNNLEYNYDGNDCCENTCKSSREYDCGFDETGDFLLGYEMCRSEQPIKFMNWTGWTSSLSLRREVVKSIGVSSSGQLVALSFKGSNRVRIFDSVASDLIMRGSSIRYHTPTSSETFGIEIQISTQRNMIRNDRTYLPVSVLIRDDYNIYNSEWEEDTNLWKTNAIDLNTTDSSGLQKIQSFQLHTDGNIFSVNFENSKPVVFSRQNRDDEWTFRQIPTQVMDTMDKFAKKELKHVSMCDNDKLVFANERCFALLSLDLATGFDNLHSECVQRKIQMIRVSNKCDAFAAMTYNGNTSKEGLIEAFFIKEDKFEKIDTPLRGIKPHETIKSILHISGILEITTHDKPRKKMKVFEYFNEIWKSIEVNAGSVRQISSDGTKAFDVVKSTESNDSLQASFDIAVYSRQVYCGTGERYYFTFNVPDGPRNFFWEIVAYSSILSKTKNEIRVGNIYNTKGASYAEIICVTNLEITCITISINSTVLQESSNNYEIGMAANGTVQWKIQSNQTNNVYKIPIGKHKFCDV